MNDLTREERIELQAELIWSDSAALEEACDGSITIPASAFEHLIHLRSLSKIYEHSTDKCFSPSIIEVLIKSFLEELIPAIDDRVNDLAADKVDGKDYVPSWIDDAAPWRNR